MAHQRLVNTHALTLARKCLGSVRGLMRSEEAGDAMKEFYEFACGQLEQFAEELRRMDARLNPMREKP